MPADQRPDYLIALSKCWIFSLRFYILIRYRNVEISRTCEHVMAPCRKIVPMLYTSGAFLLIASFFIFFANCQQNDLPDIASHTPAKIDWTLFSKPVVYFGVISRYNTRIMFEDYQPSMDYLTAETPHRFELKPGKLYEDDTPRQDYTIVFAVVNPIRRIPNKFPGMQVDA